jgi:hypothetical protein
VKSDVSSSPLRGDTPPPDRRQEGEQILIAVDPESLANHLRRRGRSRAPRDRSHARIACRGGGRGGRDCRCRRASARSVYRPCRAGNMRRRRHATCMPSDYAQARAGEEQMPRRCLPTTQPPRLVAPLRRDPGRCHRLGGTQAEPRGIENIRASQPRRRKNT